MTGEWPLRSSWGTPASEKTAEAVPASPRSPQQLCACHPQTPHLAPSRCLRKGKENTPLGPAFIRLSAKALFTLLGLAGRQPPCWFSWQYPLLQLFTDYSSSDHFFITAFIPLTAAYSRIPRPTSCPAEHTRSDRQEGHETGAPMGEILRGFRIIFLERGWGQGNSPLPSFPSAHPPRARLICGWGGGQVGLVW